MSKCTPYFLLSVLLLVANAELSQAQPSRSPNIVMICVDDLNDFIGGMGHPDAITPNLDKLIKKGTLFTNAQ